MNAQQWQRVKEVFGDALTVAVQQRTGFIAGACGDDDQVLREVEKLVSSFDDGYMQEPAITEVAKQCDAARVEAGEIISHYRIERLIGTGGMGEVYLAEDINLGRYVAIKVLPPDSAFDPSAEKRLIREARAAAALDHPNIGAIYEVCDVEGLKFIVMQYLRGETLADRLARGPIPLNQALEIAIQIADALSEAHARGVVHRDIKPSNVMIDSQLKVKVLDFGLAKRSTLNSEESIESMFSRPGLIFGTVAYMSPEQARGLATDFRTDIWSFGVLLYEMLTGRQPFSAATSSDTIAAVLKSDPPPMDVEGCRVSQILVSIVRKAISKDPADRYQSVNEMLQEMRGLSPHDLSPGTPQHAFEKTQSLVTPPGYRPSTREMEAYSTEAPQLAPVTQGFASSRRAIWAASAIVLLLAAAGGSWYLIGSFRGRGNSESPLISQLYSWKRGIGDLGGGAKFSPDGKLIAFPSTRDGVSAIWLKQVSGGDAFTQNHDQWPELSPVFSPDGDQIAFLSKRGDENGIWAMPSFGGTPRLLRNVDPNVQKLIRWSHDGDRIYFASQKDLFALVLPSKQIESLTDLGSTKSIDNNFAVSPEDDRIAYSANVDGQTDIWVMSLGAGRETSRVTNDEFEESGLVWHPDGKRIVYDAVRNGISQLFVCGVDRSEPALVLFRDSNAFISDISHDGSNILYSYERDDVELWRVQLDTVSESPVTKGLNIEVWAEVSPDGRTVVYQETPDLRVDYLNAGIVTQQIGDGGSRFEIVGDGFLPRWSPDGNQVAFYRNAGGMANLWTVPATGGEPRQITTEGVTIAAYSLMPFVRIQTQEYQWSLDGSSLIYCARRNNLSNLWRGGADGSGETRLTDLSDPDVWLFNPFLSPDGRRIAFVRLDQPATHPERKMWSIWIHESGETKMLYQSDSVLGILGWNGPGNQVIVRKTLASNSYTILPATIQILGISPGTGESRILRQIQDAYANNISLAPDRDTLAYVIRDNGKDSLRVGAVSGGASRTISKSNDDRVFFTNIAWSPDGKSLVVGKQSNWQMISTMGNFK